MLKWLTNVSLKMNYKCDGRTTFFQYSIIIVLESHVLRYTCAFRVITCLSRGIDIYSLFTRSHFFQNRKGIPPLHIFLFCMYNLNVISFTQKSMLLYWNRVIYNAISKKYTRQSIMHWGIKPFFINKWGKTKQHFSVTSKTFWSLCKI